MKSVQVYDPALCCSTGVCGVDVDQQLVSFAADVDWAKQQGARIERFNLAQQPMAFANNAVVAEFLEHSGQEGLPLILADGAIALSGRYPDRNDLAALAGIEVAAFAPLELTEQIRELIAIGAAIGSSCEPCFKFHYDKGRKLGLSADAMSEAVKIGEAVKQASAKNILGLAERILGVEVEKPSSSGGCADATAPSKPKSGCCGS